MDRLSEAIILATKAHDGQQDKADEPYILHPLRIALTLTDPLARQVALLHDVVEDSPVTLQDLRQAGFDETVVTAVAALTRDDSESYEDYIQRLLPNDLARLVKRRDLMDNLARNRDNPKVSPLKIQQYEQALVTLDHYEKG